MVRQALSQRIRRGAGSTARPSLRHLEDPSATFSKSSPSHTRPPLDGGSFRIEGLGLRNF